MEPISPVHPAAFAIFWSAFQLVFNGHDLHEHSFSALLLSECFQSLEPPEETGSGSGRLVTVVTAAACLSGNPAELL